MCSHEGAFPLPGPGVMYQELVGMETACCNNMRWDRNKTVPGYSQDVVQNSYVYQTVEPIALLCCSFEVNNGNDPRYVKQLSKIRAQKVSSYAKVTCNTIT
ncbi:unnamed protein product [Callosobruchus maculatus]|uniref:Uncharacterized protein n=1 Tax=Callosobruchus maculatus TaxID=64391 RepID=A0A653CF75_CALMS|nr:unnamed protein product [Callosobruchus maculatus]